MNDLVQQIQKTGQELIDTANKKLDEISKLRVDCGFYTVYGNMDADEWEYRYLVYTYGRSFILTHKQLNTADAHKLDRSVKTNIKKCLKSLFKLINNGTNQYREWVIRQPFTLSVWENTEGVQINITFIGASVVARSNILEEISKIEREHPFVMADRPKIAALGC